MYTHTLTYVFTHLVAVNVDSLHNRPSNSDKYDDFYEFITDEIMLYGQKNLIQKVKIKEGEYKVPWTIDSEASTCMRYSLTCSLTHLLNNSTVYSLTHAGATSISVCYSIESITADSVGL